MENPSWWVYFAHRYVAGCLLHRINTATVAVVLIRAEKLHCDDLRLWCLDFLLTLEAESLMSLLRENKELAEEEGDPSALLSPTTVAEVLSATQALAVPLVEAMPLGRIDVIESLLEAKADPMQKSREGKLPLQIALEASQDEVVEVLIRSAGKQILNVRAADGADPMDTLLHVAVRCVFSLLQPSQCFALRSWSWGWSWELAIGYWLLAIGNLEVEVVRKECLYKCDTDPYIPDNKYIYQRLTAQAVPPTHDSPDKPPNVFIYLSIYLFIC